MHFQESDKYYLQKKEGTFFMLSHHYTVRKYWIENLQIYSQSSQTPLTDCFTLTGSSEGNLNRTVFAEVAFFDCLV